MVKAWEEKFQLLKDFKKLYGHVDVPTKPCCGDNGGAAVHSVNSSSEDDTLNAGLIDAENKIEGGGDDDDVLTSRKKLTEDQIKSIGRWISSQKKKYREMKKDFVASNPVMRDRFQRLSELGIDLESESATDFGGGYSQNNTIDINESAGGSSNRYKSLWYMRYKQLCDFKEKHGHANVSIHNNESNPQLLRWVANQRELWKSRRRNVAKHQGPESKEKHALSDEKIELLKKIGFEFSMYDKTFNDRIGELKAYKAQNGHIEVRASENKTLYDWIHRQRALFREYMQGHTKSRHTMTNERIALLEDIGFDWHYSFEVIDKDTMKAAVAKASIDEPSRKCKRSDQDRSNDKAQQSHGSPEAMNVSDQINDSTKSDSATSLDSNLMISFALTGNEKEIMNDSGVLFSPTLPHKKGTKPHIWRQNYDELVSFQTTHGHCRVPGKYPPNPKLGYWVKLQREGTSKSSPFSLIHAKTFLTFNQIRLQAFARGQALSYE